MKPMSPTRISAVLLRLGWRISVKQLILLWGVLTLVAAGSLALVLHLQVESRDPTAERASANRD